MGICSNCTEPHSRFKDAAHTKPASYCAACHAAHMRANRPIHSELPEDARIKANARAYANVYQKRGKLAVEPCCDCGGKKAEKHHEDYSQPLIVTWLCRLCHLIRHKSQPRETIPPEKHAQNQIKI